MSDNMGIMDYLYYSDLLYFVIIVMGIVSLIASARVNSVFNKYNKRPSMSGMTGAETAKRMLDYAGIHDVRIRAVQGKLSDHYNPTTKEVCLSEEVFYGNTISAIGVAAHECGHAIQHQEEYAPLKIRAAILPVANLGSKLGVPLVFLGILLSYNALLMDIGILIFSAAVLFQLVTLPVEFDASDRAIKLTESYGILYPQEAGDCKKVLRTAGMTYVASAAISLLQLLRLLVMRRGRD